MSFTKKVGLVALAAAAWAGTAAFADNVTTDYNHNTNFRSFHTFSFIKVQSADPFVTDRIQAEITADLGQAGYRRVPTGGDLAIAAVEGEHDQKEYSTFYDGLGAGGWGWGGWGGWGGGWGPEYGSTRVEQVPVGTLMVNMFDNSTHQLVWRGRSATDLSNNSEKNTKKFDKDIDHMLNGFPPRSNG